MNKLADRFNEGKPKYSLIDLPSLEVMVRVLEFGTNKYKRNQWKRGLKVTEIIDSLLRHISAFLDGEDIDPESGISHIGHIQCNAMFLSYMMNNKPELDDRSREVKDG